MEFLCKHFTQLTRDELYEICKLRVAVFIVEQQCAYPEIDGADRDAYHLWLQDGDGIQAYLRVLPPGAAFDPGSVGRVIAVQRRPGRGGGGPGLRGGPGGWLLYTSPSPRDRQKTRLPASA